MAYSWHKKGELMRIILFSPHTDDGELGCGGTIAKMIEQGADVFHYAFSSCENTNDNQEKHVEEMAMSDKVLGIQASAILHPPGAKEFAMRSIYKDRQEVLNAMVDLRMNINPDLVFVPSSNDTHQDHQTIREEAFRAFKQCSILGYEMPWNNLQFKTDIFTRLDYSHVQRKLEAIQCYHTQYGKTYFDPDFVLALAKIRGTQVGALYAEAMECIRWML